MKIKKLALLSLGIAVLILLGMNFQSTDRVWNRWLKGENREYYGNINLWHINDEYNVKLPYEKMLKKYEKENFGVFVNVVYLSREEAIGRLDKGETPDLVTYSQNVFASPSQMLKTLETVGGPFENAGKSEGELKGYPICYDTYSLILNDDVIGETTEELPGVVEPSYITDTLAKQEYKNGAVPLGFRDYGGMLNLVYSTDRACDLVYTQSTLKDFEKGKTVMLMCRTKELEQYGGSLPSYSAYRFSGLTDKVRYISVFKGKDKNRVKCSEDIAKLFVSEKYQDIVGDYAFKITETQTVNKDMPVEMMRVFYSDFDLSAFQHINEANQKQLTEVISKALG